MRKLIFVIWMVCGAILVMAQDVRKELKTDVNRSAGIFYALPVSKPGQDTPAPAGKKPFYINHYGCPASFYLEKPHDYKKPLDILAKADRLGKLSKLGRDVLRRLELVYHDALHRSGEMKDEGGRMMREQMRQLTARFPEMFADNSFIDARSIVETHCIQTANEALVELSKQCHSKMYVVASHRNRQWMDPVDKQLSSQRIDSLTSLHYNRFYELNTSDTRLMELLFSDQNYIVSHINAAELGRLLFKVAGSIQQTDLSHSVTLYDIFTPEEIYRHWRKQNAWNYICYGGYTQNSGYQAYMQRPLLRNMIHMGDSILKRNLSVGHIRYTHENVILSLACLMELDGYGLHTASLDSLEEKGWADDRIAPLGGSIEMIHYRSGSDDPDVLVKVLLNGREARLPIPTDCAPYYHWQDVKHYYLRKLYRYENRRFNQKTK